VERGGQIWDIAMVTLLLHTGLRLHELCTLTWRDVQLTARTGLVNGTRGKGAKQRQLPLNTEARRALMILPSAELERYWGLIAALKVRTRNTKGRQLSTPEAIRLFEDYGIDTPEGRVVAPRHC
jgi:integrase